MAGNSALVRMGACDIEYGGEDLGYTQGGCSVSFSTESVEITCDQEDTPIGEIITKQVFEVKVPLTEWALDRFAQVLPSATLVTDGVDSTKKKLVLTGEAGGNLLDISQKLILKPKGVDSSEWITVFHASPVPSLEFSFEKENQRVYEVTFKALKGADGFVTFGDETATP